jgi:type I restriction enzyme S subunit
MMDGMKDSGIRWIGTIPENWNTKRIKYVANLKGRIGWQGLTSEEYQDEGAFLITGVDFLDGGIDWENCVHVPMKRWEEAKDIQIEEGDLLITKDGTVGKVAIVKDMPGETSLNSGVLRIMPIEGYSRRFLYWVIQSEEFWNWFNYKNAGNSTIIHLYQGDFAEFLYAFPDYAEQEAIADYLDKHCAKLDSIISDLEQQIETLQKYKKSLITEAVTKGLDKSAPMKDSGIEWIGKIPEYWDAKRLKYLLSSPLQYGANEAGDDYDEEWPRYIRITDITEDNRLREDGKLSLEPKLAKPYILEQGDVLFARSGATVGKTFYYRNEYGLAAFAGYLIKAKTKRSMLLPKFLYYTTLGIGYENWKNMVFTQATIQNIGADKYAQLIVTVPPISEQEDIVGYLDGVCGEIDEILDIKITQRDRMQQHKQSIIFEYVTGKKRVKEAM